MATQTIPLNTPSTAPLIFTNTSTGATGPGPIGTISASDGSVNVSLSADGQAANVTLTSSTTATLTWSDPSGVVPNFTVDVTDSGSVGQITGAFGTFVPGTTS